LKKKRIELALITGGSSGIGLALAKSLALQGVSLCLLARDQAKLDRAKIELETLITQENQTIEIISCDVRDHESLSEHLERWTIEAGVPDLVINSAGVTYPGYFQELDIETFHWLMDINYFGTVHVLKCLLPKMIERNSGTVVNISSQAGFAGVFGYSGYSASKYAVRGFTDVLRAEMKPHGIHCHIVYPPDTQTPQLEFEAPLKPAETKAIASTSSILTAEQVAEEIIKGVEINRYVILPGFEGKVLYRLVNLLGNIIYPIMDWMVRKAQSSK
jgi:3-dehydrosphinganine reductase